MLGCWGMETVGWFGFGYLQACPVLVKRRTIRANNFVFRTHIQKNMRVIVGRFGTDTFEFPCTNMDYGSANIVVEMRRGMIGHLVPRKRFI